MVPKSKFKAHSRNTLFQRQKGLCYYCKQPVLKAELTIDHVVPKSKGGTHTLDNFVGSCIKCNSEKGSLSFAEFLAVMEYRRLFNGQ